MKMSKYIDHTQLKQNATKEDIIKLCNEAKEYDFMTVCINPCWLSLATELLQGSDVKPCVVIGFPLGAMTTESKVFEAKDAVSKGAQEVDMVINIGKLKDGDYEYVKEEIRQIKEAIGDKLLKVIIECCLLSDEEKVLACKASVEAGAEYVKTSTGFSTSGATVEDVKLMKETVGDQAKVKAAGGIRTKEDFEKMIEAGAERIGTSSGCSLVS